MKIIHPKTIPAKQIDEVVDLKCDLCGRLAGNQLLWKDSYIDDYENKVATDCEVTIFIKDWYGNIRLPMLEVDLCPKCYRDRLIPWFQSQGVNVD